MVPFSETAPVPAVSRDHGFDNIRGLLMMCVVLGHVLEVSAPFHGSTYLYRVIYSFHMPVFWFLSGYFARFSPGKILHSWVIPYGIFQGLYILFARLALNTDIPLQFTTPYSHLWFLLAGILYQLLLPLFDTDDTKKQLLTLAGVFAVAILIGNEETVSYYASLSRFFVYQPWFVMGLYYRKAVRKNAAFICRPPKLIVYALVPAAVVCSAAGMYFLNISREMLFCSYPYCELGYTPVTRCIIMLMSLSWLAFFLYLVKPVCGRRIPLLTGIGQNTMPVFLLHQFITKAIPVFAPDLIDTPGLIVVFTLALLLFFGNPFWSRIIRILCLDPTAVRKSRKPESPEHG